MKHTQSCHAVFVALLIATTSLTVSCSTDTPVEQRGEETDSRSSGDDSDSSAGLTITAADTTWKETMIPF